MGDTTGRGGLPYPSGSDANDVPGDLQALAERVALLLGATPLTALQRDALEGDDLYAGRAVLVTDASGGPRIEVRHDGSWVAAQRAGDYAAAQHTHSADDVTTGTLADGRIPNLNTSKITAGKFPVARGGTGASTAAGARSNLDAAAATHSHGFEDLPNTSARSGASSYEGNGLSSRTISLPFTPRLVVVTRTTTNDDTSVYAMSGPSGITSEFGLRVRDGLFVPSRSDRERPRIVVEGFVVGGNLDGELNSSGGTYRFLALGS